MNVTAHRSSVLWGCVLVGLTFARPTAAQTVAELMARLADIPRPAGDAAQCMRPEGVRAIDATVGAIAALEGAEADAALVDLTSADRHDAVRKAAVTWLGRTRGAVSLELFRRLIDAGPAGSLFIQHVVLAIARVPGEPALAALVDLLRQHPRPSIKYLALVGLTKRPELEAAAELKAAARDTSSLGRQAHWLLHRQRQARQ